MSDENEKKLPAAESVIAENKQTDTAISEKASSTETKKEKTSSQPSASDLLDAEIGEVKIRKAKGSKNVTTGICNILATFNNTKVCFTDLKGNVISWSSSGKCNFRGSRKSTGYAAQVVTNDAGRTAMSHGMKEVYVHVKGPGLGRDSAIRALQSLGFIVLAIDDVTSIRHNGCRPKKRRRV